MKEFHTVQVENNYASPILCTMHLIGNTCLKFSEIIGSNF